MKSPLLKGFKNTLDKYLSRAAHGISEPSLEVGVGSGDFGGALLAHFFWRSALNYFPPAALNQMLTYKGKC